LNESNRQWKRSLPDACCNRAGGLRIRPDRSAPMKEQSKRREQKLMIKNIDSKTCRGCGICDKEENRNHMKDVSDRLMQKWVGESEEVDSAAFVPAFKVG